MSKIPFGARSISICRFGLNFVLLWLAFTSAVPAPAAPSVVDEPLGARYSLGLTLWHLGHNGPLIERFHDFVRSRDLSPEKLLPESALQPRASTTRLLLEPELLAKDQFGGWSSDKEFITSGAGDAGPTVSLPLTVPRAGLFRLWVLYFGNPGARGVTSLSIYRAGQEAEGPLAQADEFYDEPAPRSGPQWHSLLIDLPAGELVVKLGHVTRWWHGGAGMTFAASTACI